MADEISIKVTAKFIQTDETALRRVLEMTDSEANWNFEHANIVASSGGESAFSFPAGGAYLIVKNLDSTNYVGFGTVTTVYPLRLLPEAVFVLYGINSYFYYRADTDNCELEFIWVTPGA